MAKLTYIAVDRGHLVSGHTATVSYNITFLVSSFNRFRNLVRIRTPTLNGNRQTTYDRGDDMINIVATFIKTTAEDDLREFFTSVEAGETFTFDPEDASLGTTTFVCELESNDYAPSRQGKQDLWDIPLTFLVVG